MKERRFEVTAGCHVEFRCCPACNRQLKVGDKYFAMPVGPGDNPIARELAKRGRAYDPTFAYFHAECAGVFG